MKSLFHRTVSFVLAVLLCLMAVPVVTRAASQPVQVISWEDYKAGAKANTSASDIEVTKTADYIQANVKTKGPKNPTQRAINYTISDPSLLSAGDSVLIRVIARAVDTEGEMYLSLGKSNESQKSTATVTVPTTWTEFFFPLSAGAPASILYVRVGQKVQIIQIKDMELINYGDTDLSTLPTGKRDATVAPTVDFSSYKAGAARNHADVVVSQQTGTGLYKNYMRAAVNAIASNKTQRAVNYTLSSVAAGDNVLVRLVARGVGSEGILCMTLRDSVGKKEVSSSDYAVPTTWTEYYIPLCLASAAPNRLILRLGHKVQTIEVADMEVINYGDTALSTLPIGSRSLIEPDSETPSEPVMNKDFTQALAGTVSTSASYTFANGDLTVNSGDMILLSMVVRGDTASRHIRVTAAFENASTVMEYAVPVQATRINMPITADGSLVRFTVEALDGAVVISEAIAENRGTATQESLLVESGMHMLADEYTDYKLSETGVGAGKTNDLVCNDGYIYSIGNGALTVSDAAQKKILGTVDGLGVTRQIALCESGTDVMVTARGYGAWIINVADPNNPVVRAHYDSVEMATGIFIDGNYAYISCRQYGVDVVDLTDLDHPKHVCIIRTGEVQSCQVVDNILYAGLWSEHRVDMYDVTDPGNAKKLGAANLSGRGDGTALYKKDGKIYLFAATGHHSAKSKAVTTPLSDLEYGQGNGLDVFDVTDPANPIWLSTSKTDGRFYSPSYDYWSVELSEDPSGKLYAYLSSTYNGAFVYDMTDLKAPIRKAHVYIEIPKTSSNYSALTSTSRTVAYPFDRSQLNWGVVGAVSVEDGRLYLAGATSDLIILENDALFHTPVAQTNSTNIQVSDDFYGFDGDGLTGFKLYSAGTQVHAAVVHGDHVFAAGGARGILIFDTELNLIKEIDTPTLRGNCYDVRIHNGILYAAEGSDGLAAYELNGTTLTQLWRHDSAGRAVKQVRLSATGKFAMLHLANSRCVILRLTDKVEVKDMVPGSQMYHHNVINEVVGGRYMCFWANSGDERWFDFGPNDSYDVPVQIHNFKPRCPMNGGIEAVGNLALSTTGSGYVIYDPATVTDISTGLTNYRPGQNISGKPSEHQGILITTNRFNGKIYIMDVSTLTAPKLQKAFTVSGHPIIAAYGEDSIYIPLGYQGIMKFDRAPFDARVEQDELTVTVDTQVTMDDAPQTVAVSGGSGTGALSYTVSDNTVASVDAAGKLTYLKPGTFTVTVTKAADDTYKAQTATSAVITVSAIDLTGAEVTLSQTEYTYDGTAKEPTVTVKLGGKTLTAGTDYTVAYSNNTNVGTATVTITGKGNYTGTATKTFTISPAGIAGAEVTLSQTEYTYDGTAKEPTVTVKIGGKTLAAGTDYTVAYSNNTNVGTATVTVTFRGSYTGTETKTFVIAPKALTVTVKAADKAWDGTKTAQIAESTLEGVISGDDVTVVPGTAEFASAEVGKDIPVTFSGFALAGAAAGNYTLTKPAAGTATITVAKAAAEVEEQIKALPDATELTEAQKQQVKTVKAAYDALDKELQKQITKASAEKLQKLVELADKKPAVTPSTGDTTPLVLLGLLALMSAAGAVLLSLRRRQV